MRQSTFFGVIIASYFIFFLAGILMAVSDQYGYSPEHIEILAELLAGIVIMFGLHFRLKDMGNESWGCAVIPIVLIISIGSYFYFSRSWWAFCIPSALFCFFPSKDDK